MVALRWAARGRPARTGGRHGWCPTAPTTGGGGSGLRGLLWLRLLGCDVRCAEVQVAPSPRALLLRRCAVRFCHGGWLEERDWSICSPAAALLWRGELNERRLNESTASESATQSASRRQGKIACRRPQPALHRLPRCRVFPAAVSSLSSSPRAGQLRGRGGGCGKGDQAAGEERTSLVLAARARERSIDREVASPRPSVVPGAASRLAFPCEGPASSLLAAGGRKKSAKRTD
jgi:hypothetical protein